MGGLAGGTVLVPFSCHSALQSLGPGTSPNLNAVSLQPGPSLMQAAATMLAVGLLASESACDTQELIQVCVLVVRSIFFLRMRLVHQIQCDAGRRNCPP